MGTYTEEDGGSRNAIQGVRLAKSADAASRSATATLSTHRRRVSTETT